jgi:hypothetical protein
MNAITPDKDTSMGTVTGLDAGGTFTSADDKEYVSERIDKSTMTESEETRYTVETN